MRTLLLSAMVWMSAHAFAVTPFELPWMNGTHGVSTYKSSPHAAAGGVFVVEAYFLGCHYCNENAHNVNDLNDKYANDKRVQVLDVGVDRSDSQYQEWIRRHRPKHPVLKDGDRKLVGQLGTSSYPSTYVIDAKGSVVFKTTGVWDSAKKLQIQNAIDSALKSDLR